eukprot:g9583.t1 g9583   contig4:68919-70833(+)
MMKVASQTDAPIANMEEDLTKTMDHEVDEMNKISIGGASTPSSSPPADIVYESTHEGMIHPAQRPSNYPPFTRISSVGSIESHGSAEPPPYWYPSQRSGYSNNKQKKSPKRTVVHKMDRKVSIDHGKYDDSMTLHQLKGDIIKVAKEQDGSRFIQQRLETTSDPTEIDVAFNEALPSIEEIWNDVYGNFILQWLLDVGTDEMKKVFAERFKSDIVSLATRVYGCRVIQKAFDTLKAEDVASLVSAFKGNVVFCIHDMNGNHVLQKSITVLSAHAKEAQDLGQTVSSLVQSSLDTIIDEVAQDMEGLSRHTYGCRVVQRMVENCVEPQKSRILDSIIACRKQLIEDQYGNYVIQRCLQYGRPSDRDAIFESITVNNNVIKLSKQKQASNVVETMLSHLTQAVSKSEDRRKKVGL